MIRNFKQFINENESRQNPMSIFPAINNPFSEFVERMEERVKTFSNRIYEMTSEMDNAIETILKDFEDVVVGEPVITANLDIVIVEIQTSIPNNDEAWAADSSPALDLEKSLSRDYNDIDVDMDVDEKDGNCVIVLRKYMIDLDNFGDYTDIVEKLGEE
jgi:hypothetical protein